jgi:sugar phosphate isomerase/epimerase
MHSRRDFLKTSLAAVAASTLANSAWAAAGPPIGLQLYSVRNQAQGDLPALLKKLREIGYDEVETYWNLYTHPATELRKMITDAGMTVPSGHFDYEKVESSFDYAHQLGVKYMVCPILPENMRNAGLDVFKRVAENLNKWGEQAQKAGFRFAYHNHNYEFQKYGDTDGYQTLLANTDPKLVWFEMDCYWVTQAGHDPVQMMKSVGKRVRLLHIKDRLPNFPTSQTLGKPAEHFTEVGTGTLDFKAIAAQARAIGVEHYFVEQDEISKPVFESLTTSYNNAKKLLS